MRVTESQFIGNKAYSESMCLKFDGFSLDIRHSLFEYNAGVSKDLYVGAEGGSMNLGADNMIFQNVTIRNITSAKGAGIFFHNKYQKKYQTLDARNLRITFNYGIQTSGLEFDASLLTGLFVFTDCSINDNIVEFYGVVSTFYFTEVMLHFVRCEFLRNTGLSAGAAMSFYHFGGLVFVNESIFTQNQLIKNVFVGGAAIFLYGTTFYCLVYVKNSMFIENFSQLKGGAIATVFGQVHCQNCSFIDNNAPYGGAVNVAVYCPGSYINSRFSSSSSRIRSFYGGGLFLADEAVLTLTNCTFENLSAEFGGAIKMEGLKLSLVLNNVTFKGNKANRGAAIDFSNSLKIYTNMTQVAFLSNECTDSIVNLANMALTVSGVKFILNKGRAFVLKLVVLLMSNLVIDGHFCDGVDMVGCGGYFQELSFVNISSANISKITSNFMEDLFSIADSILEMRKVKLSSIRTDSKSTMIFAKGSDVFISSSFVEGLYGELLNLEDSYMKIDGFSVNNVNNNKSDFGTIYCLLCRTFTLRNSKFLQAVGNKIGGALTLVKGVGTTGIYNTTFEKCGSKGKGGALYISFTDINITISNFLSNSAEESGGAIYFDCDLTEECLWRLSNNTFINNTAKLLGGGAYHSNAYIPLGRNTNIFLDNLAGYGPDFSSFPVRITLQGKRTVEYDNREENDSIALDCESTPDYCSIFRVGSGQNIPWFGFYLIDTYGQQMNLEDGLGFFELAKQSDFSPQGSKFQQSDDSSQVENVKMPPLSSGALNSTIESFSNIKEGSAIQASTNSLVKGVTTVQSERGFLNFSEIQIIADPGSFITVKVKSDLIPRFRGEYLPENSTFDRMELSTGEYTFTLKAYLRNCERGEIYIKEKNVCFRCPKNYYSLQTNDSDCRVCPNNAICEGGDRIIVNQGFWRSSTNSTQIYPCNPLSDPCLGGYETTCREGHTGILCGSCIFNAEEKWFKKAIYFCEKCKNLYIYMIVLVVALFIIFGFIIYLIWSKKNQDPESYILVKMITTHIQTISFISNIKITLPTVLSNFNSAQAPATSTESFVFAFECFKDSFNLSIYAIKLFASLGLVLFICLVIMMYYFSWGILKKKVKKIIYKKK